MFDQHYKSMRFAQINDLRQITKTVCFATCASNTEEKECFENRKILKISKIAKIIEKHEKS